MANFRGFPAAAPPQYLMPEKDEVSAQSYLHAPRAAALVPLQQAAITGALVGMVIELVCIKVRFQDGWFWSLVIFLLVTLATWLVLQSHWFELTSIHKLESMTGIDLDHDGKVGEPTAKQHSIHVDLHETTPDGSYHGQSANFVIDEAKLATLARGLLGNRPLTEREWAGNGKLLSVDQFRAMRSELLKRHLIVPKNIKDARQGFELTKSGRAVMEHFAGAE